ncbi:UNVERIFIED_CONTAM: hypothetical protein RMT77_010261 [Armadillidium vulgare]
MILTKYILTFLVIIIALCEVGIASTNDDRRRRERRIRIREERRERERAVRRITRSRNFIRSRGPAPVVRNPFIRRQNRFQGSFSVLSWLRGSQSQFQSIPMILDPALLEIGGKYQGSAPVPEHSISLNSSSGAVFGWGFP